jgi:peptidoglycan/LPS O-acetylase OafA/YrhL
MYQWLFILVCQQYLRPWNNGTVTGVLLILAFYATCVAVAMFSYRFFETPSPSSSSRQ